MKVKNDEIQDLFIQMRKNDQHQIDVAARANISESKISKIFRGRVEPKPGELERLKKAIAAKG